MRIRTVPAAGIVLFAGLSLADLSLTRIILHDGGGAAGEVNPFARAWLEQHGWAGFATFKIAAMLLVMAITVFLFLSAPRWGRRVLAFACLSVGSVVLYSVCLLTMAVPQFAQTRAAPPQYAASGPRPLILHWKHHRHWRSPGPEKRIDSRQ